MINLIGFSDMLQQFIPAEGLLQIMLFIIILNIPILNQLSEKSSAKFVLIFTGSYTWCMMQMCVIHFFGFSLTKLIVCGLIAIFLNVTFIPQIFYLAATCYKKYRHRKITIHNNVVNDMSSASNKRNAKYSTINVMPFELGDRMKYYENESLKITNVSKNSPFIVRIDGRSFSKFTKKFKKDAEQKYNLPYSPEFKRIMILVATDLLHEFKAATVYTHSDEITLIFAPTFTDGEANEYIFKGKVFKILTAISSFASVSFFNRMTQEFKFTVKPTDTFDMVRFTKHERLPTFDARLIVFPKEKEYEITNHMIWRSKADCTRNYVSAFAEKYIGKNELNNLSTKQRIEKLKTEHEIDLNDQNMIEIEMKHGVFMKRSNNLLRTSYFVFQNLQFSNELYTFFLNSAKLNDYIFFANSKQMFDEMKTTIYDSTNINNLFRYTTTNHITNLSFL